MADTLPPIENINNEWINVYSVLGVEVGTPLVLQNTGSSTLLLHVSELQPSEDAEGKHLYPLTDNQLNTGNNGLWVKNSPMGVGLARLQADIYGGIDETGVGINLFPDSLQVQMPTRVLTAGEAQFTLLTNNTTAPIAIDQMVNAEAIATGGGIEPNGTSFVSIGVYFNPDLTGATETASQAKAYAVGYDGAFVDITGGGILFNGLTGFNPAVNPDSLRLTGGQVSFYETNQSINPESYSRSTTFVRPYTVAVGGQIVIAVVNLPVNDNGTEALVSALFAGSFLTLTARVEIQPAPLITEGGDPITTEGGDPVTTE